MRHRALVLTVAPHRAGRLEHDLRASPYRLDDVGFGTEVVLTVVVPEPDVAGFRAWLAGRTGGEVEADDAGPRTLFLP